ncbi:MAG: hypothetical protein C4581_01650 [Nitrospiraceae bacterium]|nr:MAG: hypothetical protein C4581_01650 [Nitrospiraceae bacterium]
MRTKGPISKPTKYDALLKFFSGLAQLRSEIGLYLAKITDSRLFRLVLEHKRPVTMFLYMVWLAGCGYWFYQLMIIDVKPKENFGLVMSDSRDALTILFFGTLGAVFVFFFVFFVIKFIYNLFHHGIESFFSVRWYSLIRPLSYLLVLCVAFSFTAIIKVTGLTAYNQIAGLFHTSQQHSIILEKEIPDDLEKKLSGLMKALDKESQE